MIDPPCGPLASVLLPASSVMFFFAFSMILPFSPTTALLAEIKPLCLIAPAKMLMVPASAIILPTLTAVFSGAVRSTRNSGFCESTSSTLLPAARMISPLGLVMTPLFSTLGATR